MPCRDYDPRYSSEIDMQERLDRLTRMLCGLCTRIETRIKRVNESDTLIETSNDHLEAFITGDPDLEKWWKRHKKQDALRRRREAKEKREEAARKKALAKLSKKEKDLFGL